MLEILEEIVLGPALNDHITPFLDEHAGLSSIHFLPYFSWTEKFSEDEDENKLEFTTLFQEYTELIGTYRLSVVFCVIDFLGIESFLEAQIAESIEGFTLSAFEASLVENQDQVAGEVFELLYSLGDFEEFKQTMVSHKRSLAPNPINSLEGAILSLSFSSFSFLSSRRRRGERRPQASRGDEGRIK